LGEEKSASDLEALFDATNQNLSNQMKRSLEYIKGAAPLMINKGILTGGGSLTPGLMDYLKNEMDASDIEVFNPVEFVKAPAELLPQLQKVGPALSVCIGLAMRKVR
jgi:Tfp pilus assembly PilM family ATPase